MMKLMLMNEEQISQLYHERMKADFPPSELKHLSAILRMCRMGRYEVLAAYEDGEFAAYALLYCPKDETAALLDYLAVMPHLRGKGIGTRLIQTLRQYYKTRYAVLMIECERPKAAPDEEEARKRIRFYTKAGAELTNVRIWLFDVEYSILVLSCTSASHTREWAELMLSMYRQMLPEELYLNKVRLIRS